MRIFSGSAVAKELGDAINDIEEAALRLPVSNKASTVLRTGLAKLQRTQSELTGTEEA